MVEIEELGMVVGAVAVAVVVAVVADDDADVVVCISSSSGPRCWFRRRSCEM